MVVPASPAGRRAPSALRRLIRGALAAVCLGALGAVAVDCNLVIGAGDYMVGGACPSGACAKCGGFTDVVTPCGACDASSCCAEGEACRKSPACAALFDCRAACAKSDPACLSACEQHHGAGSDAAAAALSTCQAQSCTGPCTTCGGVVDWYSDACAECVATTCCDKGTACSGDPVCAELQACYRACTYPSCPIDCQSRIAASSGQPLDSDVIAGVDLCTSVGCRTQCSFGAHWSCVSTVSWPKPTPGATVSLKVHATTFESNGMTAFAGATILACPRNDFACINPINKGSPNLTGADGTLVLILPSGFDGFLDVTAPNTLESLVYQAWPLTMATSTYELELGSYDLYKSLVMSGGGTVVDADGALYVYTRDCLGAAAPGVALTLVTPGPDVSRFYFVGGSPVDSMPANGPHVTTTDAIGGFSNVVPGTATVIATLGENGPMIAQFTAEVRATTLTYVTLTPTPN